MSLISQTNAAVTHEAYTVDRRQTTAQANKSDCEPAVN